MSGFVKVDRDQIELLANAQERGIYITLVTRAAWQRTIVVFRGRHYALERGQLVVSVRALADELGVSRDALHRFLKRCTSIATHTAPHATVITICNYSENQEPQGDTAPPTAPLPHHHRTTTRTTEQEGRREERKEPPYSPPTLTLVSNEPPPGKTYAWVGHGKHRLTQEDYDLWTERFPHIDLDRELYAADAWCVDNPEKAKSWFHVFNRWMERADEEARLAPSPGSRHDGSDVDYVRP